MRPELIERAIDIILACCDPEQVYVVGSQATGTAKRTSDLDLLIVQRTQEHRRGRETRVELLLAPLAIPVDIHVYTPDEFDDERRQRFGFARTAPQTGRLVYCRALGRRRFVDAATGVPAGPAGTGP